MSQPYSIERKKILLIDESTEGRSLLTGLLASEFAVTSIDSGERALAIIAGGYLPDLILIDLMMSDIDGFEVCRRLKKSFATQDIPIIFVTARNDQTLERAGFEIGGADYITKPLNPPVVKARVRTQIENKSARDFLRNQNAYLEREVARRTAQVTAVQDATIQAFASLAETRDVDTGRHIRRTQAYIKLLAETLKYHPKFKSYLTAEKIDFLFKAAPLHDIGKVGVPDSVLLKRGRLSTDEEELMRQHPKLGRDAIVRAEESADTKVPILEVAKEIAYCHHERWDGTGYPDGLIGDDIPISARLMALADVYDALVNRRVYKEGKSHDEAVVIIKEGRGKHFDPDVVDAFLRVENEFRSIAEGLID